MSESSRAGRRARPFSAAMMLPVGALTLVATLVLALAPAPALAQDEDAIGISAQPGDGVEPDTRSRFSYEIGPGQHVEDSYFVTNSGTVPLEVQVFATDAYNTADGDFALLDTDEPAVSAGTWVTFGEDAETRVTLTLEPGEAEALPFTVTVPADATPGDHAAGLVVSSTAADDQVVLDRRVATRLYVRVPGELQPLLTISSISASHLPLWHPFGGSASVTVTVRNSGNVALGATTTTGVRTWFGRQAGTELVSEVAELLPGSVRTITYEVPDVASLGYLAPYVVLRPTSDVEDVAALGLDEVHRSTVVVAVPWLLLGLVLAGLAIWQVLRSRRRQDARRAEAWIAHTEAEARRQAQAEARAAAGLVEDAPR